MVNLVISKDVQILCVKNVAFNWSIFALILLNLQYFYAYRIKFFVIFVADAEVVNIYAENYISIIIIIIIIKYNVIVYSPSLPWISLKSKNETALTIILSANKRNFNKKTVGCLKTFYICMSRFQFKVVSIFKRNILCLAII